MGVTRRWCLAGFAGASLGLTSASFANDAGSAMNIVALGASNTAGWGVGAQNAYPAQLEAMLRARGYDAHVANAGISFDTTAGMLRRIDADVPAGTSIVILNPGGNDLRFFGSKEQRAANIAAMVSRMRARNIKVIVFENSIVPDADYQWDGIHFNTEGHTVVATYLLQQLTTAVKPREDGAKRAPLAVRDPQ